MSRLTGDDLRRPRFDPALGRRAAVERLFRGLLLLTTAGALLVLCVLLGSVTLRAVGWLDWQFLTSFPAPYPEEAGFFAAIAGTLWLVVLATPVAVPLGVATAVYLEEYAPRGRLRHWIETNISNLAGVPSIVYGILGLVVFVRVAQLGRSVLAGALTMALLVLPTVVVAAQEAVAAVPRTWREAAYALGASRWQVVREVVLPAALPGVLTGSILAVGRLIGETAPLIVVGALTYVAFVPSGPLDSFTVMPVQIYAWTSRPQAEFQSLAAAGIVVLLVTLVVCNGLAIWLRDRAQRRVVE